ncbi:MAG: SDR family NAD(P)-dependent oxidoreductase [Bacteroidota bacterium]
MRFKDQVVFITGGASGIGKAAAFAFAQEGAHIAIADIQEELGKQVAAELNGQGTKATFVYCNVSDYGSVQAAVKHCHTHHGRLDIGLNNAGIGGPMATTRELELPDWDKVIAVNQSGVFYCMKEELTIMEQQGSGCIVNVSSIAGLRGLPRQMAYTASKHAVIGMTKATALEYARYGIRVNAVCPVFTNTPLADQLFAAAEGIDQKLLRTIPMRRFGEVDDIVNAILWLCDPASNFITGLALPIDGGQSV